MKKFLACLAVACALLGCVFGLTACDFFGGSSGNGGGSGGSTGGSGTESSSCNHSGGLYNVTYLDESTCTQEGRSLDVYVCTNSVKDKTGKEIMCGAVFASKNATEQLGQVQGLTEYSFKYMLEQGTEGLLPYLSSYLVTLPKANHTPVTDEAVEATCSATGLTEGSHCGVCNTVLTAQQTVPKSSHDFSDKFVFGTETYDICKMCGKLSGTEYSLKVKLRVDTNTYTVTGIEGDWQQLDFDEFISYNGKPITEIERVAFMKNETIKYVNIGGDITVLGEGAFWGCTALEEVVIGSGITTLERETFAYCPKLKKVTIADSITKINGTPTFTGSITPFEECPIETATVSAMLLPYINNDALKTVCVIGGSSRHVLDLNGKSSINGCENLTDITISNEVTYIGDDISFRNCTKLASITFNGTMAQWNAIEKDTYWTYNTGEFVVKCTDGWLDKNGNETEQQPA